MAPAATASARRWPATLVGRRPERVGGRWPRPPARRSSEQGGGADQVERAPVARARLQPSTRPMAAVTAASHHQEQAVASGGVAARAPTAADARRADAPRRRGCDRSDRVRPRRPDRAASAGAPTATSGPSPTTRAQRWPDVATARARPPPRPWPPGPRGRQPRVGRPGRWRPPPRRRSWPTPGPLERSTRSSTQKAREPTVPSTSTMVDQPAPCVDGHRRAHHRDQEGAEVVEHGGRGRQRATQGATGQQAAAAQQARARPSFTASGMWSHCTATNTAAAANSEERAGGRDPDGPGSGCGPGLGVGRRRGWLEPRVGRGRRRRLGPGRRGWTQRGVGHGSTVSLERSPDHPGVIPQRPLGTP